MKRSGEYTFPVSTMMYLEDWKTIHAKHGQFVKESVDEAESVYLSPGSYWIVCSCGEHFLTSEKEVDLP